MKKGLMLYWNGRISEGMWKADHKDGVSHELFANGNHYEGHYRDGKPHGISSLLVRERSV